jgi:hypothetical protein
MKTYLRAIEDLETKIVGHRPLTDASRRVLLNAAVDCDDAMHSLMRAMEEIDEVVDYLPTNVARVHGFRALDVAGAVVERAHRLRQAQERLNSRREVLVHLVEALYGQGAMTLLAELAEPGPARKAA